jgi:hypothetical protein
LPAIDFFHCRYFLTFSILFRVISFFFATNFLSATGASLRFARRIIKRNLDRLSRKLANPVLWGTARQHGQAKFPDLNHFTMQEQ